MEKKLHLLESFHATGSDGRDYKVMGYEHLVCAAPAVDGHETWESTGQVEYRLDSGERVEMGRDGGMAVAASGVSLSRPGASTAGPSRQSRARRGQATH